MKFKNCLSASIFMASALFAGCDGSDKVSSVPSEDSQYSVTDSLMDNTFYTEPIDSLELEGRKILLIKIALLSWLMEDETNINAARRLLMEQSNEAEVSSYLNKMGERADKVFLRGESTYLMEGQSTVLFIVPKETNMLGKLMVDRDPDAKKSFIKYIFDESSSVD